MIEGYFPGPGGRMAGPPADERPGRVDPIGVAPAEVVAQAVRCELLEAVAEAAAEYKARRCRSYKPLPGESYFTTEHRMNAHIREALDALDAALVAAGATGKAGT